MKNRDFFDLINSEEKAYWLGFFYADGSLRKSGKQLAIIISPRDVEHLQLFADIFDLPIKIYHTRPDKRTGKSYGQARVLISSVHMWQQIHQKGVPQRKSLAETSEVLNYIPEELMRHFIRGYFDGDGHIGCVNETEWRFVLSGTETFLGSVQNLMCSNLNLRKTKITPAGNIAHLQWGGCRHLNRIKEWFYSGSTVYLSRKKMLFDKVP